MSVQKIEAGTDTVGDTGSTIWANLHNCLDLKLTQAPWMSYGYYVLRVMSESREHSRTDESSDSRAPHYMHVLHCNPEL